MPKKKRLFETSRDEEIAIIAAAQLRADVEASSRGPSLLNVGQHIGKALNVGPVAVSRLLQKAKAKGYLSLQFQAAGIDPELLQAARTRYVGKEELAPLGEGHGVQIKVLSATTEVAFYAEAARLLTSAILERARGVGIMFGRMVHLLQKQASTIVKPDPKRDLMFIPLVGDPLYSMGFGQAHYSASLHAADFARLFLGEKGAIGPSLTGVPVYIGTDFRDADGNIPDLLHRFISKTNGYRRIFEADDDGVPIVKKLDTVITSVGVIDLASENKSGAFLQELKLQERKSFLELGEFILGDMGGLLLPRENPTEGGQSMLEQINRGWTGVKKEDLAVIRRNAVSRGSLGVVVVAFDPARHVAVRYVRDRGLADIILMSAALAERLEVHG